MGVASSNLPEMAALGVEVFIYPIVASMWFNTRCGGGWAVAGTWSYLYFLLRVGFDLRDPLKAYSPILQQQELSEALALYFRYYPIFLAIALFIGWFICLLMDIREPIGFGALWPSFTTRNLNNIVSTPCRPIDLEKLRAYYCMCNKGLQRWCLSYIEPPYWHIFVGILLALWTLTLPFFLFSYLLTINKYAAFFVPLVLRIVGYVVAWLYWSYRTALYVWGPTEYNMQGRLEAARNDPDNSVYAEDPDISGIEWALYAETQAVINKNVLIIGLIDVLGFILVGGLIVFPSMPDVDVVWVVGLAFILLLGLIFAIIGLVYYTRTGIEPICPTICVITGRPLGSHKPTGTMLGARAPVKHDTTLAVAKVKHDNLYYRGNKLDRFLTAL